MDRNTNQKLAATTAIKLGAATAGDALLSALEARHTIFSMTQQAEDAVLRPADKGAWPLTLRVALAARIAAVNSLPDLAQHYCEMEDLAQYRDITSPDNDGHSLGLSHVIAYMDAVAISPSDTQVDDVRALQQAGVTDADIVRLTELNAFMAYQVRLVSALALMNVNNHE